MASSDFEGLDWMTVIRWALCFCLANAHRVVVGLVEPRNIGTDLFAVFVVSSN